MGREGRRRRVEEKGEGEEEGGRRRGRRGRGRGGKGRREEGRRRGEEGERKEGGGERREGKGGGERRYTNKMVMCELKISNSRLRCSLQALAITSYKSKLNLFNTTLHRVKMTG